jgi:hypothetical protein
LENCADKSQVPPLKEDAGVRHGVVSRQAMLVFNYVEIRYFV